MAKKIKNEKTDRVRLSKAKQSLGGENGFQGILYEMLKTESKRNEVAAKGNSECEKVYNK